MAKKELVAVFLVTSDVERHVSFYRDTVGLRLTRHELGHSAWFDAGPVPLVIHKPEPLGSLEADYTPETPVLLWFRPEEGVEGLVGRLQASQVQVEKPNNASNYAYVRDPEGRILGFHEFPVAADAG